MAFSKQFPGRLARVFNGQFKVSDETGLQAKQMTVSFSAGTAGVFTLSDLDHREELHLFQMAELQDILQKDLIQEADNGADDSDGGLPSELQAAGIQHEVSYGQVHKNSIPLEIIQKLPYIFMIEKGLQPELLLQQRTLVKASKDKDVQIKFMQRFHFKHGSLKGIRRFMDNFMVSESQAISEQALSDVSSEHFMDVVPGNP